MAKRDCAHLPIWKESVDLAHAVLASLEESGARGTGAGREACHAAVSIPSLVEEALFDDGGRDARAALERAREGLRRLRATLSSPDLAPLIPTAERSFLFDGAARLDRGLAGIPLPPGQAGTGAEDAAGALGLLPPRP
jgi:hypothetical protein